MRIAIAGYAIESSTFTRLVTTANEFAFFRGDELLQQYDLASAAAGRTVDWVPVLHAEGGAGGPVDAATKDEIVAEVIEGLRAAHERAPLDGVYLDWHGASHTQGRKRDEEAFVRQIREVVGETTVLSMSMDPHGNLSRELAELLDFVTSFRHSPHLDAAAGRQRALQHLVAILHSGERPWRAWVRVPVLLPGELTSTTAEPGASVFLAAEAASSRPGVQDAAIWVGFAWADEDRNAGAVLVAGEPAAITKTAAELAQRFWDARKRFRIVTEHHGSLQDAFRLVCDGATRPVWIADSGDNVTAGGSGDITVALRAALDEPGFLAAAGAILFAQLIDGAALKAAVEAGEGAELDIAIGAGTDDRFGGPVVGPWRVERLVMGRYGEGTAAALLFGRGVHVVVQTARLNFTPPTDPTAWARLGHVWFDVGRWDVIVVKNGYFFPGQQALAATQFLAVTPGGSDLDFDRLPFSVVRRPMFPLDRDFQADLSPVLLPPRGRLHTGAGRVSS